MSGQAVVGYRVVGGERPVKAGSAPALGEFDLENRVGPSNPQRRPADVRELVSAENAGRNLVVEQQKPWSGGRTVRSDEVAEHDRRWRGQIACT